MAVHLLDDPLVPGKRLLTGLIAGGLYVLSITAIDAPFSVLALGGPTAVQLSLVDTATFNETRVAFEFEKATKAAQLVPALRTQEGRFAGLAQREVESGSQSGRKGAGKVSEGFLQVATVLGGLADGLEAGRTKTEGLQPQLTAALAQLKRHVYTQGDIRDRSQAVSVAADKIDELLGQVQGYNYTASITATLAVLESLFPKQTSGKDEFQATQNAELAIIGEMAKPIAEALRGALAGQKVDTTPPGVMRPRGAMEAIRVYWRDLLPQWVASIFLDLSPALLLVLLLAGRREVVALQQDAKKGTSK